MVTNRSEPAIVQKWFGMWNMDGIGIPVSSRWEKQMRRGLDGRLN